MPSMKRNLVPEVLRSAMLALLMATVGLPLVTRAGYVAARRTAMELMSEGRYAPALDAFLAMAESARNDYQRADALQQAAISAMHLERDGDALELIAGIPLPHLARIAHMRLMAERKQWSGIIKEFEKDDFADWPPTTAADAFYLRGLAYRHLKDLESARRDLSAAARRTQRAQVFFELAGVCAALKLDVEAMDAYLNVQRALGSSGGWQYNTAVITRAGILIRNGFYALALDELDKTPDLAGYWLVQNMIRRGQALAALERTAEAVAVYRAALATDGIYNVQRTTINEALAALDAAQADANDRP